MGLKRWFSEAWQKAAGNKNSAADVNRLSQPGRYGAGMFSTWRAMLQEMQFGAKIPPIKPEDAKNGIDNSIVAICLTWIVTSWLVAVPQVGTLSPSDAFKPLSSRHAFVDLLEQPLSATDEYRNLMWSLIPDCIRHGNA